MKKKDVEESLQRHRPALPGGGSGGLHEELALMYGMSAELSMSMSSGSMNFKNTANLLHCVASSPTPLALNGVSLCGGVGPAGGSDVIELRYGYLRDLVSRSPLSLSHASFFN